MVSSSIPPHDLQLVIDFVNTRDLEAESDELDTPAALAVWLQDRGLAAANTDSATAEAHAAALDLREALRAAALAHNGPELSAEAATVLERVARRGQLSVRFSEDGSVELAPRADGVDGALARLIVPVAEATADGTWERVKACRADDCLWAFYDSSRNRSGRWCDMAVCGNRTKVRAYRSKHAGS